MVHGETEKMDGGGRNSNGSTRLELRLGVFLGFSNLALRKVIFYFTR